MTTTAEAAPGPYLDLKAAAKLDPSGRGGRPPSLSAMTRKILKGIRLRDGGRLRLQAIRTSSGWRTTEAWLRQFEAALTADRLRTDNGDGTTTIPATSSPDSPSPGRRSAHERAAASAEAGKMLAALGYR